jgi:hypothetical protein
MKTKKTKKDLARKPAGLRVLSLANLNNVNGGACSNTSPCSDPPKKPPGASF